MRTSKQELRCFCVRKPLLAIYGTDKEGRTFVHCRVYKQNRVYGDWISYGGVVKLRCRECIRWHVIRFIVERNTAILQESTVPAEVDGSGMMGRDNKEVEA